MNITKALGLGRSENCDKENLMVYLPSISISFLVKVG